MRGLHDPVGLVDVRAASTGGSGRSRHRRSVVADRTALHPSCPRLMILRLLTFASDTGESVPAQLRSGDDEAVRAASLLRALLSTAFSRVVRRALTNLNTRCDPRPQRRIATGRHRSAARRLATPVARSTSGLACTHRRSRRTCARCTPPAWCVRRATGRGHRLDGGQLAAAHHVVDLRIRDVESFGDVGHQQEPGFHSETRSSFGSVCHYSRPPRPATAITPDRPSHHGRARRPACLLCRPTASR